MPWSEAELAEMKAAWERSLRTRTQAELDEMLLTRCEDVNEYGDEDDDLMKVIEAGGDIEHAAMRGLERVWEALDWFENHKSLQSETYQRLFAKLRRLQRAWQDDAEDPYSDDKENLRAENPAPQPAHDNADERAPPPHAEAPNKRKRDADAACASLGDDSLCRARIPELSRPRLRLYLKSMGASTHGNPQELKDRLLQLFVLNDIDPDEPQVRFDALKWYHPNDTYVSVWDENAKKWDEVQVRRTVVRITKVPASARDIAAPAVPSNSRFVEGELAALHTAWEAEVKSKLAPAN